MMDRRPSARVPISARPAALHDRPDPAGGQQVQDLARMQPGDLEARRAQRVQLVAEPGTGTQVRRLQQGRVLRRAQRPGRADRHSGVVRERRDVDRLRQLAVGHTVQGDASGRTDRRVPGEADGLGVEHPDGALDGPLRAAGQPHRDRIGVQLAGRSGDLTQAVRHRGHPQFAELCVGHLRRPRERRRGPARGVVDRDGAAEAELCALVADVQAFGPVGEHLPEHRRAPVARRPDAR